MLNLSDFIDSVVGETPAWSRANIYEAIEDVTREGYTLVWHDMPCHERYISLLSYVCLLLFNCDAETTQVTLAGVTVSVLSLK